MLLDSQLYLPQDWADDPLRRAEHDIPDDVTFQTKPQIALGLVDRALGNGVRMAWWTADELYGRDSKFLDGLEQRGQRFVVEIPSDTRVWTSQPEVIREDPPHTGRGRPKQTPHVAEDEPPREVRNLIKHSSKFNDQSWQKYVIKETHKGPEVWKIKHLTVWRQTSTHLPSRRHTLIVARSVRTCETKFFLANAIVGEADVTLRALLRVAFSRWGIEAELRVSKEELGLDHFEVRGWRCIHRHYYVTGLSFLFCSRLRQQLDKPASGQLTVEQIRRSVNCWLEHHDLPPELRDKKFQQELDTQRYYQQRNAQAIKSHSRTRRELYLKLGFDVDKIKTCVPPK